MSGIDAASLATIQAFYDTIVETTVPVSSPKEAELTKLLENTFRHVKHRPGQRDRHVRR